MEVREFEDVVLSDGPKRTCLYDRDGRRIDASALPRYDDDLNVELWRAAETDDDRPVRRTISTPVVYHSILFNHWGHFLLESLARAWAHIEHPALAGVPALFSWSIYSAEFGDPYRSVLDAADIMALGQTSPPRKMRLAKCYVPTPSLATVGYAHPAHLLAPQRVARQLFSGAARDSRPVYFIARGTQAARSGPSDARQRGRTRTGARRRRGAYRQDAGAIARRADRRDQRA